MGDTARAHLWHTAALAACHAARLRALAACHAARLHALAAADGDSDPPSRALRGADAVVAVSSRYEPRQRSLAASLADAHRQRC